jgi:hypothetical protein
MGRQAEVLRIRIAAPPVDGAANAALVRYLAESLGIRRSAVRIERGLAGRSKTVRVTGVSPEAAAARLEPGGFARGRSGN